jgi:hypothetical protein
VRPPAAQKTLAGGSHGLYLRWRCNDSGALGCRNDDRVFMFTSTPNVLVAIACGAVALVLLLGLVNMMRGGSPNRSQKLMRWRVGLQFFAILVIMGVLWLRS